MDFNNIMKMAGDLKDKLAQAQEQAGRVTATGEAGAGLVRVVMNGRHEVVELKIDPKMMAPSEVTLVEDLIRAAFNDASVKVGEAMKNSMGDMARDFGVDLSALDKLGVPK
jgi:DNA-binding YbaB/EbfC family protein